MLEHVGRKLEIDRYRSINPCFQQTIFITKPAVQSIRKAAINLKAPAQALNLGNYWLSSGSPGSLHNCYQRQTSWSLWSLKDNWLWRHGEGDPQGTGLHSFLPALHEIGLRCRHLWLSPRSRETSLSTVENRSAPGKCRPVFSTGAS